ncbi:MAG TPA: hypothetical protein VJN50_04170 [Actinomycetota bacterium]|nr:hypothetical protein [Actinomycetota bacterium]
MTRPLTRPDAEELFGRLTVEATRRRRRRRVGRAASIVATTALVGGTLLWATGSLVGLRDRTDPGQAAETDANYVFADVGVEAHRGDTARVSFRIGWTTGEFPGWRRCTWIVLGEDGTVVGSTRDLVVSLSPGNTAHTDLEVVGEPSRAEVSCDPKRLDVGEPYAYEFHDVRVVLDDSHPVTGPYLELVYTPVWLGSGKPGVMACTWEIVDTSGTVYARTRGSFAVGEITGEPSRHTFAGEEILAPPPGGGEGLEGRIDCRPFTGA